jgi:hypothetical protein
MDKSTPHESKDDALMRQNYVIIIYIHSLPPVALPKTAGYSRQN